jgi:surfactin synthase thioesterase subunit
VTWFHCAEKRPSAAMRLICFPHAGGSAGFYRNWGKETTPAVEVHAVQYPGRANRIADPLVDDAERLARLVAEAMNPLLDRPVALFGHSMGAVIAYEVGRILQVRGCAPLHLFASGARSPHDRGDADRIAGKDDDDLVAALAGYGGTDTKVLADPELRELVLPYVRNDFHLIESYRHRPKPRLTTPVTAIIGDADPHVNHAQARRWAEVTDGRFTLTALPGDHFYLVPQQAKVTAETLRRLNIPTVT